MRLDNDSQRLGDGDADGMKYAQQALEDTRRRRTEATNSDVDGSVFSNLASEAWQQKRGFKPSDGQIISDGIVILAAGEVCI